MLKLAGNTMDALMLQPNGTRFGGWLLNTADNQFGLAADFDKDGAAEVFVSSPWGVGVLKLAGNTMDALMLQPNGTRFGGWLLNTADNQFGLAPTSIRTEPPRYSSPARGASACSSWRGIRWSR